VVTVVGLLSLLNIGSTAAFGAIIALSSLALYFSYFIAISCMLYARFQPNPVQLGGWNLGRYGVYVNAFALIYTVWVMIFLPFPTTLPVDGVNMNYCGPIFAAVLIFAVSLWFLRGRKHWPGPNIEIIRLIVSEE
jgi:choline transport protein